MKKMLMLMGVLAVLGAGVTACKKTVVNETTHETVPANPSEAPADAPAEAPSEAPAH